MMTEPAVVNFAREKHAVELPEVPTPKIGPEDVLLDRGPVGLRCAAIARLQGAEVAVVGLERDRARLDVAKQYGCIPIVNDLEEWARQGDALGVEGAIDAAGVSATLKTAIQIVRP